MKTERTVVQIAGNWLFSGKEHCPFPLEIIPKYIGINLCSVESVAWEKQKDGQLTSIVIKFVPKN